MALVNTASLAAQAKGFSGLPVLRQVGLMLGLAASVALGVAVALWSQTPNYSFLYGKLTDAGAAEIIEVLDRTGIPHQYDSGSGAISVPASRVHEARLQLATEGLPKSSVTGFELLDKNQGFGTSRFMEQARYHRALEGELARSISALQSVESARVHLAIPKRSVFVRGKSKPRASVVLNLRTGNRLDDTRLAGIVHLVASSVSELDADQVTIVDQRGRLLTASQSSQEVALSANQLAFTRRLEEIYVKRIEDILTPIMGEDGFRAQVVADIDFTVVEETTESFQPDSKAIRSEETSEEKTSAGGPAGVPGALTNQPPGGGTTDPSQIGTEDELPVSSSRHATRNFELDRSVSHTRSAPGSIKRLSVAVVVDHLESVSKAGVSERVPLDAGELDRITALVKEAVGFDAERNDSVNVTNVSFRAGEEEAPMPEALPLWQQAWVWDAAKQALGVLLVLLLVFGVLRPVLKGLATRPAPAAALPAGEAGAAQALPGEEEHMRLSGQQPNSATLQEQQFGMTRSMVENDPKRAAQVVKSWVSADG